MHPNWRNRTLFHGDNLTFLRAMNSETVDLIATDPPFNKGRDFHATPDSLAAGARFQDRWSWEDDVHDDWVDKITDDFPHVMNVIQGSRSSYGDDMGAFLCFMGVRLLEMRRVLKPTGSIYLHCDPTASHYLKELMDAVFGRGNFRNELAWKRTSAHGDANRYASVSDRLLYYSLEGATWNRQYLPLGADYIARDYRHKDETGRYRFDNLTGPGLSDGESGKPWRGYDPGSAGRCWSVPRVGNYAHWLEANLIPDYRSLQGVHERLDALEKAGLIDWTQDGYPRLKRYFAASKGEAVSDFVADIQNVNNRSKEHLGYPTQKPLALYERIIRASSNAGDVVLDPFAGCATTCVAAERLGRQWVGMDIWDKAHDTGIERLQKEGLAAGGDSAGMLPFGDIHYATEPPPRTDDGEEAAPFLRVKERIREPEGQKMSRAEMYDFLLTQHGMKCQGCDRVFDDPRYLELDHNTPRSDGGLNHISNRILLCGPCNRAKSNTYTLSGLRRLNRKQGWMAK